MAKRSVFVSHSKADINRVNPLIEELKKADYDVSRSAHSGDVDSACLERACAFVVCLSVSYSTEDKCHSEFLMLHWQEKTLIPVILDSVSWPPGDNLFIHRDFFWELSSLMVDLSRNADDGSGGQLVNRLNSSVGSSPEQTDESWMYGSSPAKAPSPAALSSAQQKAKDDDILAQLAAQSAQYQKLASAPPSVSGRERSRSSTNRIDQSEAGTRHQSAASGRAQSSARQKDSRRSSLLTVTTMEDGAEEEHSNTINNSESVHACPEGGDLQTLDSKSDASPVNGQLKTEERERLKSKSVRSEEANSKPAHSDRTKSSNFDSDSTLVLKDKNKIKNNKITPVNISHNSSKCIDDIGTDEISDNSHKLHRRPSGGSKKSKSCSIL